jgi:hypothetical protein
MASEYIEFKLYKGKVVGKFFPESHQYWIDKKRKTGVTTYNGIVDKSGPLVSWAIELYLDFLWENVKAGIPQDELEILYYKGSKLHKERKEEAASIGDEVHKWIENYVQGNAVEMPKTKEAQIGINAFLDWERDNKVKFLSSERVVYSKKHDYIGKMDIEAKVNGKLCLIDIKTSNNIYNTYRLQTAAYVKADEEESGKKYKGRWIIRVAKETEKDYIARMEKKNYYRQLDGKKPVDYPPYQVFEAKFQDDDPANMDFDFKGFLHAKGLFEWNKATDPYLNREK